MNGRVKTSASPPLPRMAAMVPGSCATARRATDPTMLTTAPKPAVARPASVPAANVPRTPARPEAGDHQRSDTNGCRYGRPDMEIVRRRQPVERRARNECPTEDRGPETSAPGHVAESLHDVPPIRSTLSAGRMNGRPILLEQIAGDAIGMIPVEYEPQEGFRPFGRRRSHSDSPSGQSRPRQRLSTAARVSLSARNPRGRKR